MSDPTSDDILKKTFDYLQEVLEEQNHQNTIGTHEQVDEEENCGNKVKNKDPEAVQVDCCSG